MKTCLIAFLLATISAAAQTEPTTPAAQTFHDRRSGVSFQVPAGWNLTTKDGEVSTFHLDAPTALKGAQMRAVASISFNPYPQSTFSGALFYVSWIPGMSEDQCALQMPSSGANPPPTRKIDNVIFKDGYDEHGRVCVEARDQIHLAIHNNACYRFDLVINTFCGDSSDVRDITPKQIDAIRKRLESILDTVKFDAR
jgi:hypothetical protein